MLVDYDDDEPAASQATVQMDVLVKHKNECTDQVCARKFWHVLTPRRAVKPSLRRQLDNGPENSRNKIAQFMADWSQPNESGQTTVLARTKRSSFCSFADNRHFTSLTQILVSLLFAMKANCNQVRDCITKLSFM